MTKEQRRRTMQAVRSTDTSLEIRLRRALWRKGYRYRKNYARLVGKPDIVFVAARLAIFCDSEFWHGYRWAKTKSKIKSNRKFWHRKIERNMERDKEVSRQLRKDGWTVLRFWGKDIEARIDRCIRIIEEALNSKSRKHGGAVIADK